MAEFITIVLRENGFPKCISTNAIKEIDPQENRALITLNDGSTYETFDDFKTVLECLGQWNADYDELFFGSYVIRESFGSWHTLQRAVGHEPTSKIFKSHEVTEEGIKKIAIDLALDEAGLEELRNAAELVHMN